jgi:hypothetical protein
MLYYIKGDATQPAGVGIKFIAHCCNDIGAWGAGFVLALSQNLSQIPELRYKQWHQYGNNALGTGHAPFKLGNVQFAAVNPELVVCNIIGQHGVGKSLLGRRPPVRYEALRRGFDEIHDKMQVVSEVMNQTVSLHCPRLGCGLAGGNWNRIEQILNAVFYTGSIDVYVYDLK